MWYRCSALPTELSSQIGAGQYASSYIVNSGEWLWSSSKFFVVCYLACVAGGISRASAFVLVAKPWTRVAKPWEDWWSRVEFQSRLRRSRNPLRASPARNMAAPPPLARSRIPPATQAICYCSDFWHSPGTKHNNCLLTTDELTNRNVLVT